MPSFIKKCCAFIPQRWIVGAMGFFAFFNAYTLRICLSITITKMAVPLKSSEESLDETCPPYDDYVSNSSNISDNNTFGGTFEWNEYTQGIILSSFYWGYVITHVPGGLLAAKFGPKCTMGTGILITALLTIITPAATRWGDANALIIVRFLMGLCEGVIQPSMSCLLAQWIPAQERSVTGSMVYTGVRFGILISSIMSGMIIGRSNNDWPFVFHVFGGIGILWFVFWLFLCYDNPRKHPFITDQEKKFLQDQIGKVTHDNLPPFPWKLAFRSKAFIALILMQSGQDWSNYTIMSDLPKYMSSVLKLPVELNGYASSMYNVSSWVFCMVMSWISDLLIVKGCASTTYIRKLNAAISSMGPAVMMLTAMYVGCNAIAAISLITIGLTLSGSSLPGIKVNVLDLSPNYAGTLMGISNGIGAVCGILAPYMVGVLAPNQTLTEWRLIFWIVAIVYTVTTLNFLIFASGEVQKWNDPVFLMKERKKREHRNEDHLLTPNNTNNEQSN